MSTFCREEQIQGPQQVVVVDDRFAMDEIDDGADLEPASTEPASLPGARVQGGGQGESMMERPLLVIAVPYDGVAQARNGGERLAFESLVRTLLDYERIPATLCFYTEGVRWVTRDSPVLQELQEIRARGADIVACRASMAQAGLLKELAVGRLDTPDRIDDLLIDAQHAVVV